jgi:hypothetical protein
LSVAGDRDHHRRGAIRNRAELTDEVVAAGVRQSDVQQRDVGPRGLDLPERGASIVGDQRLVTQLARECGEYLGGVLVFVDDQDE